jgi:hypothetical protein
MLTSLHNLRPQLRQYSFAPDVGQDAKIDATRSERVYAPSLPPNANGDPFPKVARDEV